MWEYDAVTVVVAVAAVTMRELMVWCGSWSQGGGEEQLEQHVESVKSAQGQKAMPGVLAAVVLHTLAPLAAETSWTTCPSTHTLYSHTAPLCLTHHSHRRTLAMLGEAGYEAYAPDWPGHGESAKPAAGSGFNYSQQAYLDGLAGFVDAVGIKKPFAVVVQVRDGGGG